MPRVTNETYTEIGWQGVYNGSPLSGTCKPIAMSDLPNDCLAALKLTRLATIEQVKDAEKVARDAFNNSSVAFTHIQSAISAQCPGLILQENGLRSTTYLAQHGKGIVLVLFSNKSTYRRAIMATTIDETIVADFSEGEIMEEIVRFHAEHNQVVPFAHLAELKPAARKRLEDSAYKRSTNMVSVLQQRIDAHKRIVTKHQEAMAQDRRAMALHVARSCKYAPACATTGLDAVVTDTMIAALTAGLPLGMAPTTGTVPANAGEPIGPTEIANPHHIAGVPAVVAR